MLEEFLQKTAAKISVRNKWKIPAFAYFYQKKKRAWDVFIARSGGE